MKNKNLILYLLVYISTFFSSFLYAEDNNWVIRIKDSSGNIKRLITTDDFLTEISNISTLRGAPEESINLLLTNDLQLWQYSSQLIDQELLYMKAVEEGYDKDEDVVNLINKERDNQISQLYIQKKVGDDFKIVTDEEKRKFFNDNKTRLQALAGQNIRFDQVSQDIEYAILQERMRNEYDKIINEAKKNYNLKYSPTQDPCITIADKSIPLSNFNNVFNDALKQAGANIPSALRVQARDNMFTAFVAREVMIYEAQKTGFYDTPEAKTVEKFIIRNAVTGNYLDKAIRSKIDKPTEDEINAAYNQYGKLYRIDSLPYEQAQKALETLVIEGKTQQKYQILINDLRYRYSIEKNFDSIKNKIK